MVTAIGPLAVAGSVTVVGSLPTSEACSRAIAKPVTSTKQNVVHRQPEVAVPILSDDVIGEAMRRAKAQGCPPSGRRCSSVPRTVEDALSTLGADGWCRIGAILDVRRYGSEWDVYYHVDTGEVRLERICS